MLKRRRICIQHISFYNSMFSFKWLSCITWIHLTPITKLLWNCKYNCILVLAENECKSQLGYLFKRIKTISIYKEFECDKTKYISGLLIWRIYISGLFKRSKERLSEHLCKTITFTNITIHIYDTCVLENLTAVAAYLVHTLICYF